MSDTRKLRPFKLEAGEWERLDSAVRTAGHKNSQAWFEAKAQELFEGKVVTAPLPVEVPAEPVLAAEERRKVAVADPPRPAMPDLRNRPVMDLSKAAQARGFGAPVKARRNK